MAHSIDAIYMVEASPELRMAQKNLLCGEDAPMSESKVGYHSICKYTSLPVVWTETIKSIPISAPPVPGSRDVPRPTDPPADPKNTPFIVAHEFFDALPIHAFQNVEVPASQQDNRAASSKTTKPTRQWREMLVAPAPPGATHDSLGTPLSQRADSPVPDFQLSLAPGPTRHSLHLPESSARFRALRAVPDALVEICPDAALYATDFAARIGGSSKHPKARASGAALVLDYGPGDGAVPAGSLRGIRRHRRVSPFAQPGLVDLSADVDFAAVAEAAARASDAVEVHGPVDQAAFLAAMGGAERAEALARAAGPKEADVTRAWGRLVDRGPGGMGKLYKALAIVPENEGKRRPVGFGGDVVE